jgi:hypothetical protein
MEIPVETPSVANFGCVRPNEDMSMCTHEGRRCVAIGLDAAVQQHTIGGDPACSGSAKQRSGRA